MKAHETKHTDKTKQKCQGSVTKTKRQKGQNFHYTLHFHNNEIMKTHYEIQINLMISKIITLSLLHNVLAKQLISGLSTQGSAMLSLE